MFEGQVALVTGASRGIGRRLRCTRCARVMLVVGTATTDAGAARISAALCRLPWLPGRGAGRDRRRRGRGH
jgi:3-oxoacyl-[acyl-carrier protein] reductase